MVNFTLLLSGRSSTTCACMAKTIRFLSRNQRILSSSLGTKISVLPIIKVFNGFTYLKRTVQKIIHKLMIYV